MEAKEPLAYRMCPRTIEEFVGQEHIIGKGRMLYRMIKADRISSIILYGPPGTGKTSLARIIANSTKSNFEKLNAVTAGVGDIKRIAADAQNPMLNPTGKTVLFYNIKLNNHFCCTYFIIFTAVIIPENTVIRFIFNYKFCR